MNLYPKFYTSRGTSGKFLSDICRTKDSFYIYISNAIP